MRKNINKEILVKQDIALLYKFIIIAKINNIAINIDEVRHSFSINDKEISIAEILKISESVDLKAKYAKIKNISNLKFPAIIKFKNGSWNIILNSDGEKFIVVENINESQKIFLKSDFYEKWDGTVLLFTKKATIKLNGNFGIGWFLKSVGKYKRLLIEILIASFTMQILGLVSPLITQVVVDKVLLHKAMSTLDVLAIGLAIIIFFETLLSLVRNYIFSHTSNKIDVTLGSKLFNHLFSLPLRYFESRRVGDTVARVRQLENIRQFLTGTPMTAILDVLFIVVYIVVMFLYSSSLTYIVLLSLPIFFIISFFITPVLKKRLDEKFYAGAESQSFLVESVTGVQTIKALALEPTIQRKWEDNLANYATTGFKTSILASNASMIARAVQKIFDLIILWYGARIVIAGEISVGQLIAFRMLAARVSEPILRMVQIWQDLQQVKISIDRIGDILNTKTERNSSSKLRNLPSIIGKITMKDISFRYSLDCEEVIKNLSLDIEPGKVVGIVGRSGSGKSTLSKLIQGLYIPEKGKIFVDDIDISLVDPHWLRRQIGVVLQENFLFTGTIFENMSIQKPTATLKEVINVAKIAGAHEFIVDFPDGYDTIVGERGNSLSGGQRQRLAIARALLTNPRILIFDEATSALDYESESIIQNNMKLITKGRTVIMIAHRLSTLKDADEIVVIEKGRVVEKGNPLELIRKNGLYAHLHKQQFGGECNEERR